MTEVAFSIEQNKKISKQQVREWQQKKKITDSTQFRCLDENCKVPLSCACWKKGQYKREPYFYLTTREKHHVFNCNYASPKEIKDGIAADIEQVYETQQNKKSIVLGNPKPTGISKTDAGEVPTTAKDTSDSVDTHTIRTQTNELTHSERATHYRNLDSFVSMYYDPSISNNYSISLRFSFEDRTTPVPEGITGLDGKSSFNELFSSIQKPIATNEFHIFHGKAKIIRKNDKGFCQVLFSDNDVIKLFFNLNNVPRNSDIKKVADPVEELETLKEVQVYFEGAFCFVEKQLKAIPLTKEFYRSLLFKSL